MKRIFACPGLLVLLPTLSLAALQFSGTPDLAGQGLGSVPTVLTVQGNSANIYGCVAWNGSQDVLGDAMGAGGCGDVGDPGPDFTQQGQSQTVLFSHQDLNFVGTGLTADQIGVVFNSNQISDGPITLNNITLRVYGPGGNVVVTSAGIKDSGGTLVSSITFPNTETGTGSSGFLFKLDSDQQEMFDAALGANWNATYRFAVSIDVGCGQTPSATCAANNDGPETVKIVNLGGGGGTGNEVPEPATFMMMGGASIALALYAKRRQRIS